MQTNRYEQHAFDFAGQNSGQPLLIREAMLPVADLPLNRLRSAGPAALSTAEMLALIIGGSNSLSTAYRILEMGEAELPRLTLDALTQIKGIGQMTAARILTALNLGHRIAQISRPERPRVTSPADGANLIMAEMQHLEQEHLRVILLDTRNRVIGTPTIYIGSVNSSVVRVGEILRPATIAQAPALIVVHNHPSGDPSPSPEDISVTRTIVQAGRLLNIDVLDHLIIGHNRFVSLKERGYGFD